MAVLPWSQISIQVVLWQEGLEEVLCEVADSGDLVTLGLALARGPLEGNVAMPHGSSGPLGHTQPALGPAVSFSTLAAGPACTASWVGLAWAACLTSTDLPGAGSWPVQAAQQCQCVSILDPHWISISQLPPACTGQAGA